MRKRLLLLVLLFGFHVVQAEIPSRKGWWKFDDPASLTKAEAGYGNPLILTGSHVAAEGTSVEDGAVTIGPGSYYKMSHGLAANGGGIYTNEFTLLFDFRIEENGIWHSFFQTSTTNANDADFFVNPSGNIGVAAVGYSGYSIVPGQWYRLVISVQNGEHFTGYLDGEPFLSGEIQPVDGRFSLENPLLIFADEDGEDGNITCSELVIWDKALDSAQARELGGFGHDVEPFVMTRIPYLQAPEAHGMTISWHDSDRTGTHVEFGIDSTLGTTVTGTCELIKDPFCWHTVVLNELEPNKRYFYRVGNGQYLSPIYSFRTLPDPSQPGILRFVILSDTHSPDSTAVHQVMRSVKKTVAELYGPGGIDKYVNGILHSGDIVMNGSNLEQYTSQFFHPMSVLSPWLPTMVVAGNHEGESPFFYSYLKLDSFSAFPLQAALKEKIWSMRTGNTLFIGLNSNITGFYGTQQAAWLDNKLNDAEQDTSVDFVFLFIHHFPVSELWNVDDESIEWVRHSLVPILSGYSKVCQLHYGHTHGYERGTLSSGLSGNDFRIICGGGGGGGLDPWNSSDNHNFNDIHISYSKHFFQLLEIDVANRSYRNTVFGTDVNDRQMRGGQLDVMYRKILQEAPGQPVVESVLPEGDSVWFNLSPISGPDSLMTVHLVITRDQDNLIVVDTMAHWADIYGVDNSGDPVNLHATVNLYRIGIGNALTGGVFTAKIRYRDHNLRWSQWSPSFTFTATGLPDPDIAGTAYQLFQNYPNPFSGNTTLSYFVPERCAVRLQISDMANNLVAGYDEGIKDKGLYRLVITDAQMAKGVYFYSLITPNATLSRKMVKIR